MYFTIYSISLTIQRSMKDRRLDQWNASSNVSYVLIQVNWKTFHFHCALSRFFTASFIQIWSLWIRLFIKLYPGRRKFLYDGDSSTFLLLVHRSRPSRSPTKKGKRKRKKKTLSCSRSFRQQSTDTHLTNIDRLTKSHFSIVERVRIHILEIAGHLVVSRRSQEYIFECDFRAMWCNGTQQQSCSFGERCTEIMQRVDE